MKVVQVSYDCFRGSLEDFEKVVLEKYKDNDLYRKQYLKEIEKVKVLFELEEYKQSHNSERHETYENS